MPVNPTLTRPLADRNGTDPLALALTEFSGMVIQEAEANDRFNGSYYSFNGLGRQDDQFPAIGTIRAYRHRAGADPSPAKIPTEQRRVPYDQEEIRADVELTKVDDFIAHFETRQRYAQRIMHGLRLTTNRRVAVHIAKGARQNSRTVTGSTQTFKGGHLVRVNSSTIAGGFPVSADGSRAIQDALGAMRQSYQEAEIDTDTADLVAYLTPREARALCRDNSIMSREISDPSNPNRRLTQIISLVEGFRIVTTTTIPRVDIAEGYGENEDEVQHTGDFTKTAILTTAGKTAVAVREAGGVDPYGPVWDPWQRKSLLGAAHFSGTKWLEPYLCGEIYVHTSDYTLSGSEYGPA